MKGTATICISIIVGVATNLLSNSKGWIQALIASILCILVFFIHWYRVIQSILFLAKIIRQVCHLLFREGFMYVHIFINALIRPSLTNTANATNLNGIANDILETRF